MQGPHRVRGGPYAGRMPDPLLPDTTTDEQDTGWGEPDRDDDDRISREVPPHHGG